ncbi:MAG: sterol desaturase family protein [Leptolyngbya sp. SIO3F4]|nr:sterol desaturase family protein [Leptolyngbya sp. SIO3F4]
MTISQSALLQYESQIRFTIFFGILLLMKLWETIAPCRRLSAPKLMRWFSNVGLLFLGTIVLRAVFPLAAVGVAAMAEERQWGLFYLIPLASWQTIILSIVLLDFTTYLQHRLFHAVPMLWRLHKVHHADPDFDVTTGLRFHPLEILLSMVGKIVLVLVLGAPVIAVLLFELILNVTSMFNHGNVGLPGRLDQLLRLVVVTPDMHRVHHSVLVPETNSNFGFNIPWWDYLLGTYRERPAAGYQGMTIGLAEYQQDWRVAKLPWMLMLPFVRVKRYSSHPTRDF